MKKIITVITLLSLVLDVGATGLPVVDASAIAQSASQEIVNIAQWAKTATAEAQTQLNTLNTVENTATQLARMGNPQQIFDLPGIAQVQTLIQSGQALETDYQMWQRMLSPAGYQGNMNQVLSQFGQPQWNGFTANGVHIGPNQSMYQFPASQWQIANDAEKQLQTLEQQRQTLEAQKDQAFADLQAATDEIHILKYHATLTTLEGSLQEVMAREQQVRAQMGVKQAQLQAGQQVTQAAQREQIQASDYQIIDQGLSNLPMGQFNKPMLWNSQP
jgi:hypothetical protein